VYENCDPQEILPQDWWKKSLSFAPRCSPLKTLLTPVRALLIRELDSLPGRLFRLFHICRFITTFVHLMQPAENRPATTIRSFRVDAKKTRNLAQIVLLSACMTNYQLPARGTVA
jgi:hypothetical protein